MHKSLNHLKLELKMILGMIEKYVFRNQENFLSVVLIKFWIAIFASFSQIFFHVETDINLFIFMECRFL